MYILYCSYSTDEAVNKTLKLKKKKKKLRAKFSTEIFLFATVDTVLH